MACEVLAQLDSLIPILSGAEFKVLVKFLLLDGGTGQITVSFQELKSATNLSTSTLQQCIASLSERGLIESDGGDRKRPSTYKLLLAAQQVPAVPISKIAIPMAKIGLPKFGVPRKSPYRMSKIAIPPDAESTTYEAPSKEDARVDIDPTGLTEEIDRRQNAPRTVDADELAARLERITPAQIEPALLASFRQELASYRARFAPPGTVTEPDNRIVAQFLSIAPPRVLGRFLEDLLLDRKRPGDSYGWFVAVAAQRILHILPEDLRTARQRRREQSGVVMKPPQRETDPGWRTGFQDQVRAAAAGKRL